MSANFADLVTIIDGKNKRYIPYPLQWKDLVAAVGPYGYPKPNIGAVKTTVHEDFSDDSVPVVHDGADALSGRKKCPRCTHGELLLCESILPPHRGHKKRPPQLVCVECFANWQKCTGSVDKFTVDGFDDSLFSHFDEKKCTGLCPLMFNGVDRIGQIKGDRCFRTFKKQPHIPVKRLETPKGAVFLRGQKCSFPKKEKRTCPVCLGPKSNIGHKCCIVDKPVWTPGEVIHAQKVRYGSQYMHGYLAIMDTLHDELVCSNRPIVTALMCFQRQPRSGIKSSFFLTRFMKMAIAAFAGRGIDIVNFYAPLMLEKAKMNISRPTPPPPSSRHQNVVDICTLSAKLRSRRWYPKIPLILRGVTFEGDPFPEGCDIVRQLIDIQYTRGAERIFFHLFNAMDRDWNSLTRQLFGFVVPREVGTNESLQTLKTLKGGGGNSHISQLVPLSRRAKEVIHAIYYRKPDYRPKYTRVLQAWLRHIQRYRTKKRKLEQKIAKMCPHSSPSFKLSPEVKSLESGISSFLSQERTPPSKRIRL